MAAIVPLKPDQHRDRLRRRYDLRQSLWRVSNLPRVRGCGRRRIDRTAAVGVSVVPDGPAYYTNVARCGSIWSCTVCAAKIRDGRAGEIDQATRRHLQAGGTILFATLTFRHLKAEGLGLDPLLRRMLAAWRRTLQGDSWRAFRLSDGIVGYVRSVEVTHGRHGWHPHLHVAFFVTGPADVARDRVSDYLTSRWARSLRAEGLRPGADGIGCDVQVARSSTAVARYLVEVGDDERPHIRRSLSLELARSDLKTSRAKGRTGFQILADAAEDGDAHDLALWHEYEAATKGRRAVEWSRGLKKLYQVGETTDQDHAEAAADGVPTAEVAQADWKLVQLTPGAPYQVLHETATGGAPALARYLARLWALNRQEAA